MDGDDSWIGQELREFTKAELKRKCSEAGLVQRGTKDEIISRLLVARRTVQQFAASAAAPAASSAAPAGDAARTASAGCTVSYALGASCAAPRPKDGASAKEAKISTNPSPDVDISRPSSVPGVDVPSSSSGQDARKDGDGVGECIMCMDARAKRLLYPCGHICLCSACWEKYSPKNCPLCATPVENAVVIFVNDPDGSDSPRQDQKEDTVHPTKCDVPSTKPNMQDVAHPAKCNVPSTKCTSILPGVEINPVTVKGQCSAVPGRAAAKTPRIAVPRPNPNSQTVIAAAASQQPATKHRAESRIPVPPSPCSVTSSAPPTKDARASASKNPPALAGSAAGPRASMSQAQAATESHVSRSRSSTPKAVIGAHATGAQATLASQATGTRSVTPHSATSSNTTGMRSSMPQAATGSLLTAVRSMARVATTSHATGMRSSTPQAATGTLAAGMHSSKSEAATASNAAGSYTRRQPSSFQPQPANIADISTMPWIAKTENSRLQCLMCEQEAMPRLFHGGTSSKKHWSGKHKQNMATWDRSAPYRAKIARLKCLAEAWTKSHTKKRQLEDESPRADKAHANSAEKRQRLDTQTYGATQWQHGLGQVTGSDTGKGLAPFYVMGKGQVTGGDAVGKGLAPYNRAGKGQQHTGCWKGNGKEHVGNNSGKHKEVIRIEDILDMRSKGNTPDMGRKGNGPDMGGKGNGPDMGRKDNRPDMGRKDNRPDMGRKDNRRLMERFRRSQY